MAKKRFQRGLPQKSNKRLNLAFNQRKTMDFSFIFFSLSFWLSSRHPSSNRKPVNLAEQGLVIQVRIRLAANQSDVGKNSIGGGSPSSNRYFFGRLVYSTMISTPEVARSSSLPRAWWPF